MAERKLGCVVHEVATALLPVFFVLALGYGAGKRKPNLASIGLPLSSAVVGDQGAIAVTIGITIGP